MPKRLPVPPSPLDLMASRRRPSRERQAEMDDFMWDRKTMRVYADASVSQSMHLIGLGVAYVFDGSVITRGRKLHDPMLYRHSTYGELMALVLAIQNIPDVLKEYSTFPEAVLLHTDVEKLEQYMSSAVSDEKGIVVSAAQQLLSSLTDLQNKYPSMDAQVLYLDVDGQRWNPYYRAAHNMARKESGLRHQR